MTDTAGPTPPPTYRTETLEQRVSRLEERTYPPKLTPEQLAAYRRILDEQAERAR